MFAFRDQCGPLRPQIAFVDGYDAHFSTVLTLMKEDNIWVFFLGKSFVCPVLELREEMERHKRQKKDGLTPQQFLAAMRLGGHQLQKNRSCRRPKNRCSTLRHFGTLRPLHVRNSSFRSGQQLMETLCSSWRAWNLQQLCNTSRS
mmetsp:Transcript_5661/g.9792  ORF Transcript_5661/g.9792 Transcript_5661/m.9792 type:complete len:145 (+) Transcript_5661:129-563(+)